MANIKVTPAEEDEVIVAGGVAVEPAEPELAAEYEPVRDPEPEPEPDPEPEAAPVAAPRPSRRAAAPDDLDAGPMPLAQKVVIIAAVVCIIGAVLYYLVALR